MALEMFAVRKVRVQSWDGDPTEDRYSVQIARGGKSLVGIPSARIADVEEEVMKWRKANHIHNWFVENVQDGKDNCGLYNVSWDKMRELLSVCTKVLSASKLVSGMIEVGTVYTPDHPNGVTLREPRKVIEDPSTARELLPTLDGYLFGSLDYDERYLEAVKNTRDWVISMLRDRDQGMPSDIFYFSTWRPSGEHQEVPFPRNLAEAGF
jgi:hypothetical protein